MSIRKILNKIPYKLIPLISSFFLYIILAVVNIIFLKINFFQSWKIIIDYLLVVAISYLFFLFSKKTKVFLIIQGMLFFAFYIACSIKSAFFGMSITVEDIKIIREAIISVKMMSIWYLVLIIVFVLLFFALLIINFKFKKSGLIYFVCFFTFLSLITFFPEQSKRVIDVFDGSYLFWNNQENFKNNGPLLYLLEEYIRTNNLKSIPTEEEVEEALNKIQKTKIQNKNIIENQKNLPNIYFILVESMFDPTTLKNVSFSTKNNEPIDPFYLEFRKLIDESKSSLFSPVYEGKTANAEFELLCGIPILKNNIPFQTELKNNINCLPNILKEFGYTTNAYHADWAGFYNRDKVYSRIGFDNYYSIDSFNKDDLNNGKLSDRSFLNQALDLSKNNNAPQFNYFLTISTHTPFTLNDSREEIINNNTSIEDLYYYSNSIYYSTKEVFEFINTIYKNDENALIIITGDHLPGLGNNKELFKITDNMDEKYLQNTPLLILNNNKVIQIGDINMHNLGEKILNILDIESNSYVHNIFNSEYFSNIRYLVSDKIIEENIKINNNYSCDNLDCSNKNLEYYIKIYNDILFGKQYSISK